MSTSSHAQSNIRVSADVYGWTLDPENTDANVWTMTRSGQRIRVYFNGAGSITGAALGPDTMPITCTVSLGRRDSDKLARVMAWMRADVDAPADAAPAAPMGRQTYWATLPDGHTVTRSSATMAYVFLVAVSNDDAAADWRAASDWGVFSWHKSAAAAYRAANSGARYSAGRYAHRRVIAVTAAPYSSADAKRARAAEKAGTVDPDYLRAEVAADGARELEADAQRVRDAEEYGAALKPAARVAYTVTDTPEVHGDDVHTAEGAGDTVRRVAREHGWTVTHTHGYKLAGHNINFGNEHYTRGPVTVIAYYDGPEISAANLDANGRAIATTGQTPAYRLSEVTAWLTASPDTDGGTA